MYTAPWEPIWPNTKIKKTIPRLLTLLGASLGSIKSVETKKNICHRNPPAATGQKPFGLI